jgi:hypothetical protein
MKKLLLVVLMGCMVIPTFAHGGKKKHKHRKHRTEMVSEVRPLKRQRWVERDGDNYVIVQRTTITEEDYLRIRESQRINRRNH